MSDFGWQDEQFARNRRTWTMIAAIVCIFIVLVVRLSWLQLVEAEKHLEVSEKNRLRLDPIRAPRGLLLDREGRPLVQNRASWNVMVDPRAVRKHEKELIYRLVEFRQQDGSPFFDSAKLDHLLQRARWTPYQRQVLLEDATPEEIALFTENLYRLPGLVLEVSSRREYPYGRLAGHVLGYIAEIPEDRMDSLLQQGYRLGDLMGQMGLELQYEKVLRGTDGIRYVEVDARGRLVGVPTDMPQTEPIPGRHVRTTIDLDLQAVAEQAIPDSLNGAAVVMDPRNGEILAMVSSPRIDPNIFSLPARKRTKEYAKLALDSRRPLNNRAIQGTYEPASTFKIISSMAGMRTGRVGPRHRFPVACFGGFRLGARYQRCWQNKSPFHGQLDMFGALMQSCDVYYYQLGLAINMRPINEVAYELGYGARTGVDLPNEKAGTLMDSAIYEARNKKRGWRWSRGLILNLVIGQGQLVTPLQLANMMSGVADGERLYRPHLLQAVLDGDDRRVLERPNPEVLHELNWDPKMVGLIHDALDSVVHGSRGTGRAVKLPGMRVGGKTGSAENPHGDLTHALFVTTAPLDKPEIAIAVVLENAGGGGKMAAPVAAKILKRYFQKTGRLPPDTVQLLAGGRTASTNRVPGGAILPASTGPAGQAIPGRPTTSTTLPNPTTSAHPVAGSGRAANTVAIR